MEDLDSKIDWIRFYSERLPTKPTPAGDHKYHALCPFHREKNPSFWFNTENGCWKCESGCGSGNGQTFLCRTMNIDKKEAWEELKRIAGVDTAPKPPPVRLPLTLREYAEAKRLPMSELVKWGLKDGAPYGNIPAYVAIPYYDANGNCVATKRRYNPKNTDRFGWDKGGTPILYGAWLSLNRGAKAVILCEGESDAQSCWVHGLPCYGVPGATNFKSGWVASFIGERDVYIHVEPDSGGESFRKKTLAKLNEAGYAGNAYSFSCHDIDPECKDPSDLHVLHEKDFRKLIDPVIRNAKPEDLNDIRKEVESNEAAPSAPTEWLNVYRFSDLYGVKLERPPVVVQGMITAGLTVLAGPPKRGKSWLSLLLAVDVASGATFLGAPTTQGDVLYLDLESRKYRVQERGGKLLAGKGPDRLFITHDCKRLDAGLLEQLNHWCDSVEHPVLIIIDTLGKVKAAGQRGLNAYESDYRQYGELQRFALQRGLAIVVVQHLRKSQGGDGDDFERVSGSMGLTGVCDNVLLLKGQRGEPTSTLAIRGRDFEDTELIISLKDGQWTLRSTNSEEFLEEQAYSKSDCVRGALAVAHKYHRWRGAATALIEEMSALGIFLEDTTPRKLVSELDKMQKRMYAHDSVIYTRNRSHGNRSVELQEVQKDGF